MLFNYDDEKEMLTLLKTDGDNFIFMNGSGSSFSEVLNKPAINISTDNNVVLVGHQGAYKWNFQINRISGEILVKQSQLKMLWKGRCNVVDRSKKF